MTFTRRASLIFLLAFPAFLTAQEVKYIDLTVAPQRTELRYPPAECQEGQLCGGEGGGGVADSGPDRRDPHALGVYLLRVFPTDIDPSKPFEVEFKVLNTGTAPIQLPVSPHLSDLQPADESQSFRYLSLTLGVNAQIEKQPELPSLLAYVELYGLPGDSATLLTLQPAEWLRVKAEVKFSTPPSQEVTAQLLGTCWLHTNTFHPRPGGIFIDRSGHSPNSTPTPPVEVHIQAPLQSDQPKQSSDGPAK
jgi:hypothetical protein